MRVRQQGSHFAGGGAPKSPMEKKEGSLDYLAYVADMILELKEMAQRADATTLTGLLDLAYREACIQAKRGRGDQSAVG